MGAPFIRNVATQAQTLIIKKFVTIFIIITIIAGRLTRAAVVEAVTDAVLPFSLVLRHDGWICRIDGFIIKSRAKSSIEQGKQWKLSCTSSSEASGCGTVRGAITMYPYLK